MTSIQLKPLDIFINNFVLIQFMAKESFILVSLEDEKTKKLSQSITNETCRKILNYLSEKEDSTESQISKDLSIPMPTVNYNMKLLVENGLVEINEFHYSRKGREVDHFSLANKMIIIAPKKDDKLLSRLKKLLPVVAIIGVIGYAINFFSKPLQYVTNIIPNEVMAKSASVVEESTRMIVYEADTTLNEVAIDATDTSIQMIAQEAPKMAVDQVNNVSNNITNTITQTIQVPLLNQTSVYWFLIGAVVALLLVWLFYYLLNKK